MITNQTKDELQVLAQAVELSVKNEIRKYRSDKITTGIYNGRNMTDCVWIKNGSDESFFFVSPCLRNARAESFIDRGCNIELTLHLIDRYDERTPNDRKQKVRVCGDVDARIAAIMTKLANFYVNEKIKGVLAETKDRGKVLRTSHGLLLCSEKQLHKGVRFANTFISDNELKGTQLEAVQLFDRHQYFSAEMKYMEYFDNK